MVRKVEVAVPFVVEETEKRGVLAGVLTVFEMARREYGEVVPIPTFWFAPKKRDEVATWLPPALNVSVLPCGPIIPLPEIRQTPFTEKHPDVRFKPFAAVEVARAPVRLRYGVERPL